MKRADYGEDGVVEFYLAQIAEETGRYALALERYREVPDGERGWLAKLRVAAMLGKLGRVDEARRYLADLPAVTIEQRIQVRQAEAQLLRDAGDNATAYAVLDGGARHVSRTTRICSTTSPWSPKSSTGSTSSRRSCRA